MLTALPALPSVALAQESTDVERGLRVNAEGAFEGYTLFAPLLSRDVFLVDMDGEEVHRWEGELAPGNSVYLRDNGNLLRCYRLEDNPTFHGGGIGGRVVEMTWDGEVVWDYTLSTADRMHHHDIEPLPNGNVLFIVWERMPPDDAVQFGRDPERVSPEGFWPDGVLEIEPVQPDAGRIVWEWHSWDHLVQDTSPSRPFHGEPALEQGKIDINGDHRDRPPMTEEEREREEELEAEMRALGYVGGEEAEEEERPRNERGSSPDWLHTNSIDYNGELDLILLSSPRMNEIWVIDHSTTSEEAAGPIGGRFGLGGELLYRWGNPRNYGAGEDFDQSLFAQHDAQWIPPGHPGAGNVLVFNNGNRRPGGEHSSVDELALPIAASGAHSGFAREAGLAFGPAQPVWSYRSEDPTEFYSFFISGAQRLPNGNTLVCSGAQGRFFEVTREGEIVWEYWNPFGGEVEPSFGRAGGPANADWMDRRAVFRATRLAPDHPGLAGRL